MRAVPAGEWRCKGCGWLAKDGIGMDHPQNGCDLELMCFHPASPKLASIPAGMKPWHGGDTAPDDWDGGLTLHRDGDMVQAWGSQASAWQHYDDSSDIVAYTPKPAGGDEV